MAYAAQTPPVFVDSSAWIAVIHRRDQAHRGAVRIWSTVRARRRPLVTTNLVVTEAYKLLNRRIGRGIALRFLDSVLFRRHRTLVWVDAELTQAATEHWLRRYADKRFDLTDAVSFEVMRREGITEAFAFDRDFERAGFALLRG